MAGTKEASDYYEQLDYNNGGFIIRTNAMHAGIDSIFEEIEFLHNLWIATSDLRIYRKCYAKLYQAPSSYISSIRDGYHNEVGRFITDSRKIYKEIKDYLEVYQPEDINKLKLYDNSVTSLKVLYNVEQNLERVLSEKVWLNRRISDHSADRHSWSLMLIPENMFPRSTERVSENQSGSGR